MNKFFAHPLTRGKNIDSPETTALRKEIIRRKPFLLKIYREWYAGIRNALSSDLEGMQLELGSGAGFYKDGDPHVLTSEIFWLSGVNSVLDAQHLPFGAASLTAIVMTNVLHHIPDPELFFAEASRCIKPGGKIVMIEPWITKWSKFVYTNFHHEPLDQSAKDWRINGRGPLSSANSALPWIIFHRDRAEFSQKFPQLKINSVEPIMPFRYLLAGGISLKSLMPEFTFSFWRWVDRLFASQGMFAKIVVQRLENHGI